MDHIADRALTVYEAHLSHLFELRFGMRGTMTMQGEFCRIGTLVTDTAEKRAKHDLGETNRINRNDNSDKKEGKNESQVSGSTDSANAPSSKLLLLGYHRNSPYFVLLIHLA